MPPLSASWGSDKWVVQLSKLNQSQRIPAKDGECLSYTCLENICHWQTYCFIWRFCSVDYTMHLNHLSLSLSLNSLNFFTAFTMSELLMLSKSIANSMLLLIIYLLNTYSAYIKVSRRIHIKISSIIRWRHPLLWTVQWNIKILINTYNSFLSKQNW